MKTFLFLPLILFYLASSAQPKTKTKLKKVITTATSDSMPALLKPTTKYTDNVDDRMKGPSGEKIYIGQNGGRYYLKAGKKNYVPYGNKIKKG